MWSSASSVPQILLGYSSLCSVLDPSFAGLSPFGWIPANVAGDAGRTGKERETPKCWTRPYTVHVTDIRWSWWCSWSLEDNEWEFEGRCGHRFGKNLVLELSEMFLALLVARRGIKLSIGNPLHQLLVTERTFDHGDRSDVSVAGVETSVWSILKLWGRVLYFHILHIQYILQIFIDHAI